LIYLASTGIAMRIVIGLLVAIPHTSGTAKGCDIAGLTCLCDYFSKHGVILDVIRANCKHQVVASFHCET
jgi:hypothetical protein